MAPDIAAGRVMPVAGKGAARAKAIFAAASTAGLPELVRLCEINDPDGEITI
jgi:hypothetical protein